MGAEGDTIKEAQQVAVCQHSGTRKLWVQESNRWRKMTRQAASFISNAPLPNFRPCAMGLAQVNLGHEEEAQLALQKSVDTRDGHYAEPHFGLSALFCNQQNFTGAEP
jgi:hypothetical protein